MSQVAVAAPVESAGPGKPVGWAVAGCGWVSRDFAIPALLAGNGRARVVGVFDPDRERADALARAGGGTVATDLAALLDAPGVDAVYVATPNDDHEAVVVAAARRGLAVLCEKPLAVDLGAASRLVEACERHGVLAGTAFNQRFHPAHRRAARLVAAGALGTVTDVRLLYGCWLPPAWAPPGSAGRNWRAEPGRSGGGAVLDLAPHGIDLLGLLLGEDLTHLSILTQRQVHPYAVDDGAVLAGRTSGGVLYSARVSFNLPDALPRRRLEIVGTDGVLVATDTLGQTAGGALQFLDARTGAARDVGFDLRTGPFQAQLAAFTAAVAGAGSWPWPLRRDLRLHALLLDAASANPLPERS